MDRDEMPAYSAEKSMDMSPLSGHLPGVSQEHLSPKYTIPGVLHFLQYEFMKYEMDRSQWDVEKAELQTRVAFLQGQVNSMDMLRRDLVRRIKMLEYALRQERGKGSKSRPEVDPLPTETKKNKESKVADPLSSPAPVLDGIDAFQWRDGHRILRQYIKEITGVDTILDVQKARIRSMLGLTKEIGPKNLAAASVSMTRSGSSSVTAAKGPPQKCLPVADCSSSPSPIHLSSTESDTGDMQSVLDEQFDFLGLEGKSDSIDGMPDQSFSLSEPTVNSLDLALGIGSQGQESKSPLRLCKTDIPWDAGEQQVGKLKEIYRNEAKGRRARKKRQTIKSFAEDMQNENMYSSSSPQFDSSDQLRQDDQESVVSKEELGELATLGISESEAYVPETSSSMEGRKQWDDLFHFRGHEDAVRSLAFHPTKSLLLSASDDSTLKLWDLCKADRTRRQLVLDLEPLHVYRGHVTPVLSCAFTPDGSTLYSGSLDGQLISWNLVADNYELLSPYDPNLCGTRLDGHSDAVWHLAARAQSDVLLSSSADSTCALWSIEDGRSLATYQLSSGHGALCAEFFPAQSGLFVSSCQSGSLCMWDMETQTVITQYISEVGNGSSNPAYGVVCHQELSLLIAGYDSGHVCFFDAKSGKKVHSMVAHQQAVTSLDIDQSGLYLATSSHDGSVHLWNINTRACIQDTAPQRPKFDECVLQARFHRSQSYLASSGADSMIRVLV